MKADPKKMHKGEDTVSLHALRPIAAILRRKERCTAHTIGAECGLDIRTVKRAIVYLRVAGWVIEWDARDCTYYVGATPRLI